MGMSREYDRVAGWGTFPYAVFHGGLCLKEFEDLDDAMDYVIRLKFLNYDNIHVSDRIKLRWWVNGEWSGGSIHQG